MDIVFKLYLPRDEATVPVVRRICRENLTRLGITRECVAEIELAVTEACTNVLKHVAQTNTEYEVAVDVDERTCDIRVIDTGKGFDHSAQGVDPGVSAESGRGIFLMRAMVDELNFVSQPEVGTVVHLVKELELSEDSVLRQLALH